MQQTDGLTIETRLLGPSLLLPEIREGGGPDQMDAQMVASLPTLTRRLTNQNYCGPRRWTLAKLQTH